MKRLIAILLIMSVCMSVLTACGNKAATPLETTATTTEPTQPGEEGKSLKILTLGNSGAVDCGHMLAHIAAVEGYENFEVATLYYSGCSLAAHVTFLTKNTADYQLYLSSTDTPNKAPSIMKAVTMGQALRYDYWDIVIMQGNSWEMGSKSGDIRSNIQTIQNYIREQCLNPNAKIVWHMGWVAPTDNTLRDTYPSRRTMFTTLVMNPMETIAMRCSMQLLRASGITSFLMKPSSILFPPAWQWKMR